MSSETNLQNPVFPKAYSVTRNRTHDSGLLQIPIAGPAGTPPEIVRIHGGLSRLEIGFAAEQQGGPPRIPASELDDGNSVLLGGSQMAALPITQLQGDHLWELSGSYVYACKKQISLDSPIPTGTLPIDTGLPSLNTIPATIMTKNIVEGDRATPKEEPDQAITGNFIPRL